jgi:excisionase family DNA binding protein
MVNEVLTVEEVARLLKVTSTTVRRWCLSGRLPAFKIGRAWRIPREGLRRLTDPGGADRSSRQHLRTKAGAAPQEDLWSRMSGYYDQAKRKEGTGGSNM